MSYQHQKYYIHWQSYDNFNGNFWTKLLIDDRTENVLINERIMEQEDQVQETLPIPTRSFLYSIDITSQDFQKSDKIMLFSKV